MLKGIHTIVSIIVGLLLIAVLLKVLGVNVTIPLSIQ